MADENRSVTMPSSPLILLQNNHVARLTGPMSEAARAKGLTTRDVSSGHALESFRKLTSDGPWAPILVMGSSLFCLEWAASDPVLSPWISWRPERYDAAVWSAVLGDRFLNAAGRTTTIGALIDADGDAVHVRPLDGMKFVGERPTTESATGLMSIPGIVATADDLRRLRIDRDIAVWAAPPTVIDMEVRVWMIDGRPACWSSYRLDGRPFHSTSHPAVPAAVEAAAAISAAFSPSRHHVTDVALCDGRWRLVEYNPIHSAGWYAADPGDMLDAYLEAETGRKEEQ